MKRFFKDFKAFISRGNVMDLAIGVIIGGAFGKIVTSLVNDILMPLLGLAMGGRTLSDLVVVLNGQPRYIDGAINPACLTWNYGNFIQTIIDFLIIALCIFLILKLIMKSQEMFKTVEAKAKSGILTRSQKKELKSHGIDKKDKEAVKKYFADKQKEIEEKQKEEEAIKIQALEEAKKNTPEALLKEIRDLLKESHSNKTLM